MKLYLDLDKYPKDVLIEIIKHQQKAIEKNQNTADDVQHLKKSISEVKKVSKKIKNKSKTPINPLENKTSNLKNQIESENYITTEKMKTKDSDTNVNTLSSACNRKIPEKEKNKTRLLKKFLYHNK